jgi:dienelactone hydrolase
VLAPDLCDGRTAHTIAEAEALVEELDDDAATGRAADGIERLRAHPAERGELGVVGFSMGVWFALDLAAKTADSRRWSSTTARRAGSTVRGGGPRCSATSPNRTISSRRTR